MAKHKAPVSEVTKLLEQTADEERQLLKLERKAEKRVASLRADLAKAQKRFDEVRVLHDELQAQVKQRAQALADAEAELARHHAARASGPTLAAPEAQPVPKTLLLP